MHLTGDNVSRRLIEEQGIGGENIGCEFGWPHSVRFGPDIAFQRFCQRRFIASIQSRTIGLRPAIEHTRQFFHALGHSNIAYSEFPQGVVHLQEIGIDQLLRNLVRCRAFTPEPTQGKHHVERDHLKPAERDVWDTPLGIKYGLPRRSHDCRIQRLDDRRIRIGSAPEQATKHGTASAGQLTGCFVASDMQVVYRFCGSVQARRCDIEWSSCLSVSGSLMHCHTRTLRKLTFGAVLLGLTLSAGCNSSKTFGDLSPGETLNQGYVMDQAAIDSVPVGSSREQVLLSLGTPSTTATFDNEVLYYISQTRRRSVAFEKARLVDQKILAVYLGEDGRVADIAQYGMKDGRVFDFISRTTPTGGKDATFIGQLLAGGSKINPLGNAGGQ